MRTIIAKLKNHTVQRIDKYCSVHCIDDYCTAYREYCTVFRWILNSEEINIVQCIDTCQYCTVPIWILYSLRTAYREILYSVLMNRENPEHSALIQRSLLFENGPRQANKCLRTGANAKYKCKMRRFRSSCACAHYHLGLCSPFIYYVVSNDSVSG